MSTNAYPPPVVAGGNILPSTFVMLSTAADKTALQATAGAPIFGISGPPLHDAPGLSGSSAYAATAGLPLPLFVNGDITQVLVSSVGAAAVVRGDRLKSDATGGAVTGSPNADNIGAIALESGASGALILVQVFLQNGLATSSFVLLGASATTYQMTAANLGGTVQANNSAASVVITLPLVATISAGARFRVQTLVVPGAGVGTLLTIPAADGTAGVQMYGTVITTPSNGKGLVDTQTTAKIGDVAEVMYDGANWAVLNYTGTWVRQA